MVVWQEISGEMESLTLFYYKFTVDSALEEFNKLVNS